LRPIIVFGAAAAFAVPAHAQYANIYVQQDSSLYNVSAGFDANSGDGGVENTAYGFFALENNGCCGYYNSAFGFEALENNDLGGYNTAVGYSALWDAGNGSQNTAVGAGAMFWTSGSNNSAVGYNAMEQNSSGSNNTAVGYQTLGGNNFASAHQTGSSNSAVGANALYSNTTGNNNTALGSEALYDNSTSNNNIAVGYRAGYNLKSGYNIDIGNTGVFGDFKTIRIGTEGTQENAYIAGIYDVTSLSGGLAVFVDSTGHLGTASSSERFKTDIAPMESNTDKLRQLRPVTFHYKADPQGTLRYGLIAEEVAKVYPELVVRDDKGRIDGVRYDELAPLLLNEVQAQAGEIRSLKARAVAQADQLKITQRQVAELTGLARELRAALLELQAREQLVAQR
jgi:hypothetical protein